MRPSVPITVYCTPSYAKMQQRGESREPSPKEATRPGTRRRQTLALLHPHRRNLRRLDQTFHSLPRQASSAPNGHAGNRSLSHPLGATPLTPPLTIASITSFAITGIPGAICASTPRSHLVTPHSPLCTSPTMTVSSSPIGTSTPKRGSASPPVVSEVEPSLALPSTFSRTVPHIPPQGMQAVCYAGLYAHNIKRKLVPLVHAALAISSHFPYPFIVSSKSMACQGRATFAHSWRSC